MIDQAGTGPIAGKAPEPGPDSGQNEHFFMQRPWMTLRQLALGRRSITLSIRPYSTDSAALR
jgi:hypothetical protein